MRGGKGRRRGRAAAARAREARTRRERPRPRYRAPLTTIYAPLPPGCCWIPGAEGQPWCFFPAGEGYSQEEEMAAWEAEGIEGEEL